MRSGCQKKYNERISHLSREAESTTAVRCFIAAVFAVFSPLVSHAQTNCHDLTSSVEMQTAVSEAAERIVLTVRTLDASNGDALYASQPELFPLVSAVFKAGSTDQKTKVLTEFASFVDKLPRIDIRKNNVVIDQLAPSAVVEGQERSVRLLPVPKSTRPIISSGSGQQFAYLLSHTVRMATVNRLVEVNTTWQKALDTISNFVISDVLELYWREIRAWHWRGAFPNARARLLWRLEDRAAASRFQFYHGILDYEVHLVAIAADMLGAQHNGYRPSAERSDVLLEDIRAIGVMALMQRLESSPDQPFQYDKGAWSDHPSYRYANCTQEEPPIHQCAGIVVSAQDVSHAQRWPYWLESLSRSYNPGSSEAEIFRDWLSKLANQIGSQVLRFDRAGRPIMSNFLDGGDGWYRLRETPLTPWGHPPSSLTGDAMRYGSWFGLAALNEAISASQEGYCQAIKSSDESDVAFRHNYYRPNNVRPYPASSQNVTRFKEEQLYCKLAILSQC